MLLSTCERVEHLQQGPDSPENLKYFPSLSLQEKPACLYFKVAESVNSMCEGVFEKARRGCSTIFPAVKTVLSWLPSTHKERAVQRN